MKMTTWTMPTAMGMMNDDLDASLAYDFWNAGICFGLLSYTVTVGNGALFALGGHKHILRHRFLSRNVIHVKKVTS